MSNANLLGRNLLPAGLLAGAIVLLGTSAMPRGDGGKLELEEARLFFEYNASDSDLGVHVFLDGEDWKKMKIFNPQEKKLFDVKGSGPYAEFGMTELFFEGAEPSLKDVPLDEFLELFPEGEYEFEGQTVDGEEIEGESELTHAIPDGPAVQVTKGPGDLLVVSWMAVDSAPPGFPVQRVEVVGYQVIVDDNFQVNLPSSVLSLTLPAEYVASLEPGEHELEVLAVEEGGNQSITETDFEK